MKISNNVLFWVLQIIGWGIPTVINGMAKYIVNSTLNKAYVVVETVLFFLLGIFFSSLLRKYIRKNVDTFENLKRHIAKVSLALIVTTLGYLIALMSLSSNFYGFFHEKALVFDYQIILITSFNLFIFLFFWLIFYISIKLIMNARKKNLDYLQLESSYKDSQLNTLKSQINPHFMFNSLNNIRGLMLEDVDKARDMITRLSELLRNSLSTNNNSLITIKEEIEMVHNYIALSHIQFEEKLTYQEQVEENLLETKIPPMIIQMLIENAIKHGISEQKNGGVVKLHVFEKEQKICVKVTNTGNIKKDKESTKIGLKNISDRLQILYGKKASFKLSEKENEVVATIQLPL